MKNTGNKIDRILKGVAIGLVCLFLVLSAFLLVKVFGRNNDSMEQPDYNLSVNVPPRETLPVAEPVEDAPEATVPATEAPKEIPATEAVEETEPAEVEEEEEESPKKPGSSSKPSGGSSSNKPAKDEGIKATGTVTAENGVVTQDASFGKDGVSAQVAAGTLLEQGTSKLTLTVKEKKSSDSGVKAENGQSLLPLDVHIDGISAQNTAPVTICLGKILPGGMNIGNVALYHVEKGTANPMTQVMTTDELNAHNEFYYDPATGDVSVAMASFSEVAVLSEEAKAWEGEIDTSWYNTTDTTFEIFNADQLAGLGALVDGKVDGIAADTFKGKTVRLMLDVNLGGDKEKETGISFNPIGYGYEFYDGKVFKGTFDGNGNTISNLYQNSWDLESKTGEDYTYSMAGGGLFASVVDAKIRNLTVENAHVVMECVDMGVVVGYANGNCTFENIVVKNSRIANYQRATGGAIGEVGNGHHDLKNVDVDANTVVSSLWGDFDAPLGGIIGAKWDHGYGDYKDRKVSVYMENCDVAAQINAYNDVTSAYQWYSYRRAGMLIGNSEESKTTNGRTEATASYLECVNCTVSYGTWANYTYCEFKNTTSLNARYPWVRVQEGYSNGAYSNPRYGNPVVDGKPITAEIADHMSYHRDDDGHNVEIVFNQLYGGGQGCYGGNSHLGNGVEVKTAPDVTEKFTGKGITAVTTGTTVTLGDLFTGIAGANIQSAYVYAFVSPVDADTTARGTQVVPTANRNWEDLTITFTGEGKVKITINDYFYCQPTEITIEVKPDYSGSYYIAGIRTSDTNYQYITGAMNGTRYALADSGLTELPESISSGASDKVFVLEREGEIYRIYAYGISGEAKYLGWTDTDNSGAFVNINDALELTVDELESGLFNIHFPASETEERYLSLNSTATNTYAAWYKTGQIKDLALIPVEAICQHTNTETKNAQAATCTENGYTGDVVCSDCGSIHTEGEVIEAQGHTYEDGVCTGCGIEELVGFVKATSISVGDVIVITSDDAGMELTSISTTSTKYGIGTEFTNTPAGIWKFTVEAGSTTGTYVFKDKDGNYLYWTSGNSLTTTATLNKNSSWYVNFDANGYAHITNADTTGRQIWWNSSSPRFACYTDKALDTTGYNGLNIYKYSSGSSSEPKCEHTNKTTTTVDATCTEAGTTTVTCNDCGETVSTTEIPATGHNYVNGTCSNCGEAEPVVNVPDPRTYTFSNYTAGTQYAKNEEHRLDDIVTVTTTDCHFTSELRIYSSSTNNGNAVIYSTAPIKEISFNAGYKVDTLNVYGCNDGTTWELIASVSVTSTSYNDYSVAFDSAYTYLKLDVAGSNQIRVNSMTLTFGEAGGESGGEDTCEHTNTTTTTVDATCTEAGSVTVTCVDCGETVSTEVIPATGHDFTNGDCACGEPKPDAPAETKVTMDIIANKGELGDKVITWTSGDVTFQNAQESSTTAIRTSDTDHFRVYAKSEVTISVDSGTITKIVITCTSSDYATVMTTSLTNAGYTATVSGNDVTVTVDSKEPITFTASAQTRLNKIEVTYLEEA